MRQFKAEFQAAKAAQDWTKVQQLWEDLLVVAGVEEISPGDAGRSSDVAALRNKQAAGNFQGGKKV